MFKSLDIPSEPNSSTTTNTLQFMFLPDEEDIGFNMSNEYCWMAIKSNWHL